MTERPSGEPDAGRFADLPQDEPYPGVVRCSVQSQTATLTQYEFAPGARFPRHRHPQEQLTIVEAGELEFTVGERVQRLAAGAYSIVPGDVEHGLRAGEGGARILAIVVPRRASASDYAVTGAT